MLEPGARRGHTRGGTGGTAKHAVGTRNLMGRPIARSRFRRDRARHWLGRQAGAYDYIYISRRWFMRAGPAALVRGGTGGLEGQDCRYRTRLVARKEVKETTGLPVRTYRVAPRPDLDLTLTWTGRAPETRAPVDIYEVSETPMRTTWRRCETQFRSPQIEVSTRHQHSLFVPVRPEAAA